MPNIISFGVINVNSPQQNAGIFIGQINMTGWDANQKLNLAQGAIFGSHNWSSGHLNLTFDGYEIMDTPIFDQDIKSQIASNI